MAGNLQLYSLIFAVTGGTLLVEEQEVDMSRTTNSQQIDTVAKGYAGESPGAPMTELDIQNAIPQGGFEFDAGPYMASLTPVPVQVLGPGGQSARGNAFIISDALRHGVNAAARYSFRARMPLALFKT